MAEHTDVDLGGVDLSGSRFVVTQGMVRNRYQTTDEDGTVLFRSRRELLSLKDAFSFRDADGEDAFSLVARGVVDDERRFDLRTAAGETVAVIDNDRSVTTDVWTISDPDSEAVLARITAQGTVTTAARNVIPFADWIPHTYEITDADGAHVGTIEGFLSPYDRVEVTIADTSSVPRTPVVVTAMVRGALG